MNGATAIEPANSPAALNGWRAIPVALSDIKLAHSVFALPFALLASAMALPSGITGGRLAGLVALVVVCMVLARTWAMLVNRLADKDFDADNPRTARRAVASGRLTAKTGWAIALGTAALFVGVCSLFYFFMGNVWPVALSVPVLGWIALYSYTKRFTALCHVFLGSALAISPIAAVLAVEPSMMFIPEVGGAVALLSAFVLFWVAGFDVAYALQDLDFDRETGLRSVPAAMGTRGALHVSRAMHAVAFVCLVLAWIVSPALGTIFAGALVLVLGVLITEHTILHRQGVKGLPMAFFTLNGVISVVIAVAGITDVVLNGAID